MQTAVAQASVTQPPGTLSITAAVLLRAQARNAVIPLATVTPTRFPVIPRLGKTEDNNLLKVRLLTTQWTRPPAGLPTPWDTQLTINSLWIRDDPEISGFPVPTRVLEVRKGDTTEDHKWVNVDFLLTILLPYVETVGTEITMITSPFRMNEDRLLGPIMTNGLRYYFPTVKDRDDVNALW